MLEKRSSALEKCKTQFGKKNKFDLFGLLLLTTNMHIHTENDEVQNTIPNSLELHNMHRVNCTSTKNNVLHKLHFKQHARLVQSPKTSKQSSTIDIVPPFCSKFRAAHK